MKICKVYLFLVFAFLQSHLLFSMPGMDHSLCTQQFMNALTHGQNTQPSFYWSEGHGCVTHILQHVNERGFSPLDIAIINGDVQNFSNIVFQLQRQPLLLCHLLSRYHQTSGMTVFHLAAISSLPICSSLLNIASYYSLLSFGLLAKDNSHMTPLHYAIGNGNLENVSLICEFAIREGAFYQLMGTANAWNMTPQGYAHYRNQSAIVAYLSTLQSAPEPVGPRYFPQVLLNDASTIVITMRNEQGEYSPPVERDTNCVICFESMAANDVIGILPCAHVFHAHCIQKSLRRMGTRASGSEHRPVGNCCPVCRFNEDTIFQPITLANLVLVQKI